MKPESRCCDRELLRRALDEALPERQEEELVHHLSDCDACRRELERLAGDRDEWLRVGEALKREASLS